VARNKVVLALLSGVIVALGQSAWVPALGILAGCCGYALFWRITTRFWPAMLWFAVVQAVQISWMTETTYMGPLIWVVYLFLIAAMGAQFGLLSYLIPTQLTWRSILGLASLWTLLEWVRLFFLSGFAWSFAGTALAASATALQWASLWGIYGLSFWVILVNLVVYQRRSQLFAACLALLPYGFGAWMLSQEPKEETLSVLLVQTSFLAEEKQHMPGREELYLFPIEQWDRMLSAFPQKEKIDLIVFPENSASGSIFYPLYLGKEVEQLWKKHFGVEACANLPPHGPFEYLSNAFIAQALANHFQADLIASFQENDLEHKASYNSAFFFQPNQLEPQRYAKRILLPLAEYLPFSQWQWLRNFVANEYGISSHFHAGERDGLFTAQRVMGISICCEETFSQFARTARQQGAELLVGISNDIWFPDSKLAQQHLDLSRIRAAENGCPAVRACNAGISAAIDSFGQVVDSFDNPNIEEALYVKLPVAARNTLYSWWGDEMILGLSLLFVAIWGSRPFLTAKSGKE
jgi:apolipoprotein N-acyltransferase